MTEPTIVISFDDLVKHKDAIRDMKWTSPTAEAIYDSFMDDQKDEPYEDVGEVGGTKIIVICPGGQEFINNIFKLLIDLKISHHANY